MRSRKARVPRRLRLQVARAAGSRCGYCRTPEAIAGVRLTIEHIIPEAKGGKTVFENLWLACHACNEFKATRVLGRDPRTGKRVRLWNPQRQSWADHFRWSEDGTEIIGVTACGRATVATLRLNRPELVAARSFWVQVVGGHQRKNRLIVVHTWPLALPALANRSIPGHSSPHQLIAISEHRRRAAGVDENDLILGP